MNDRAAAARGNDRVRENFIHDSEQTILRIASQVTGKYITRSDDEWSVALLAFNKAIDTYSKEKGDYFAYAGVLIKRALIDHYRSERRHRAEIPVSNEMFAGEGDYEGNEEIYGAVSRDSIERHKQLGKAGNIRDEIIEVNEILKGYGFSFRDLKESSPKAGKTKRECARVITYILDNEEAVETVLKQRKLPIKETVAATGIKSKLLDRYRRYIIMAVVILNGEYPLLAEYLQYVRKEGDG